MPAVITRIALRYAAGALIAKGVLSPDVGTTLASDPDVLIAAGALVGAVSEGWYFVAKRLGWAR